MHWFESLRRRLHRFADDVKVDDLAVQPFSLAQVLPDSAIMERLIDQEARVLVKAATGWLLVHDGDSRSDRLLVHHLCHSNFKFYLRAVSK